MSKFEKKTKTLTQKRKQQKGRRGALTVKRRGTRKTDSGSCTLISDLLTGLIGVMTAERGRRKKAAPFGGKEKRKRGRDLGEDSRLKLRIQRLHVADWEAGQPSQRLRISCSSSSNSFLRGILSKITSHLTV